MTGWQWVTDEMFNGKMTSLASAIGTGRLLQIPGVYELVKEELNNTVLESLADEHGRCMDCGSLLDDANECHSCNDTDNQENI